jgi:hypothetical protein
MKNKLSAEAHVLDRLMYLLEENSVRHLVQQDESFAHYVDKLYAQINAKSVRLRQQVTR